MEVEKGDEPRPSDQSTGEPDKAELLALLRRINCARHISLYDEYEVEQYLEQPIDLFSHQVYIYLREQHYYVLAVCSGKLMVADGANQGSKMLQHLRRVTRVEKISFVPIDNQAREDQGPSLVAAAIAFIMMSHAIDGRTFKEELDLYPAYLEYIEVQMKLWTEKFDKKSKTKKRGGSK